MLATSLATLTLLALIDSTSIGTLLIPIWLLMTPDRVHLSRMLLFLSTVAVTYFAIGMALLLGASAFAEPLNNIQSTSGFLITQLVVGIALIAISHFMDRKQAKPNNGRISRLRSQALSSGSTLTLHALALTAVFAEVATMLPYLAAIGIITAMNHRLLFDALLLASYCLIMIAPALLLTFGRIAASSRLEKPLVKLDQWLTEHLQSTTAWIIGAIGVILALRAIFELGWVGGGS